MEEFSAAEVQFIAEHRALESMHRALYDGMHAAMQELEAHAPVQFEHARAVRIAADKATYGIVVLHEARGMSFKVASSMMLEISHHAIGTVTRWLQEAECEALSSSSSQSPVSANATHPDHNSPSTEFSSEPLTSQTHTGVSDSHSGESTHTGSTSL